MPQGWSSQSDNDPDDIDSWMVRRNAQLALHPEADAVARDLWDQATQNGGDLYAGNPSDLTAVGLAALGGGESYTPTVAADDDQADDDGPPFSPAGAGSGSQPRLRIPQNPDAPDCAAPQNKAYVPSVSELDVVGRRPVQTRHPGLLDDLNHNGAVRAVAGGLGYVGGVLWGVPRAGQHAIEGIGDAVRFAGSLLNPQGRAEAWNGTKTAAHSTLQYGRSLAANPSRLASDALSVARTANRDLNPFGTPIPNTATGAFGHELGIGANAGEAVTNVMGLASGLELAEGLNAIRGFEAAQPARIAKYMAQGFDEPAAAHLSKPYKGMGDHGPIPRRQDSVFGFKAPPLKKVSIPDWIMDSPFNVSKPRGMSQGDFYEYHYRVDPRFYGARLPQDLNGGKGWSGKRLGLERYSGPGRIWARTPSIYKDAAVGMSMGDGLHQPPRDESGIPQ